MTTARRGVSMVRAQVTAWSERRSQGGASPVVIMGTTSPVRIALGDKTQYSRPHRHLLYAPVLRRMPYAEGIGDSRDTHARRRSSVAAAADWVSTGWMPESVYQSTTSIDGYAWLCLAMPGYAWSAAADAPTGYVVSATANVRTAPSTAVRRMRNCYARIRAHLYGDNREKARQSVDDTFLIVLHQAGDGVAGPGAPAPPGLWQATSFAVGGSPRETPQWAAPCSSASTHRPPAPGHRPGPGTANQMRAPSRQCCQRRLTSADE